MAQNEIITESEDEEPDVINNKKKNSEKQIKEIKTIV
jgi:hypothetical protein